MDIHNTLNENTNVPDLQPQQSPAPQPLIKAPLNMDTIKRFFKVTGGSSLYCLSAVLIARGIVKLLKPVFVGSDTLQDALPCLLTLHAYELTLLAALLIIVFKKVVDDAISLTILISLFLIGTSIALGSVADRAIKPAMFLGLLGIVIGFIKLGLMRRYARIPFSTLSIAAITGVIAYNYLGPALMARGVSVNPTDEYARRGLWLFLYAWMLIGFLIVWIDALRREESKQEKTPFLQSPIMAYLFALLILLGSGVHQYTMAYAFTLERVLIDYVPVIAIGCFILIEMLRLSGIKDCWIAALIVCVPMVASLYAIHYQSVLSSSDIGLGLLCYPPIMFALIGLAVAVLATRRKSRLLWIVVCIYGLGMILTAGFSPEYPHDLNFFACGAILIVSLLVYGLIVRNPYVCLASVVIFSLALPTTDKFSAIVENWQLTEPGMIGGVCGLGMLIIYLIFAEKLHAAVQFLGALFFAGFIYDYLPGSLHIRYLIAFICLGLLFIVLWFRTKNMWMISILLVPVFIRIYILAKALANWRFIILGFLALMAGVYVSLFNRSIKDKVIPESEENPLE